ncbi:MAG: serine hydrolase domain-containing protein [Actinomycetota bacterium]
MSGSRGSEMEPIDDVASKLEAKTASFVKEHRLPGAAVGIVHGDALAWSAGVGFADIAARRVPDTSTLYRIASITKTFTGTAIMQLRDEGLLHLDDPAVVHLPELAAVASPFGAIDTVTIRRMLSHESGLQTDPPGTDWLVPEYEGSAERNLARTGEIATTIPPSTQQKYSNLAYQLLGEVVARRSGVPYPEYIRTRILEPLGMSGSVFEPLPGALSERCATGYAARFLSDELHLASTPPPSRAEGGLWSSVEDLARWLSLQFREDGGAREGAQILAGETLKEMHRARYLGDDAWTEAFGISWYATRKGDVVWVQHAGGLHGFISNICFDPKAKVAAIVLLNGIGDASALSMALGSIARDAVREAPPPIESAAPMPPAYRDLLGLYVDEEQAMIARVEWRDGALQIVDPDEESWRPTLSPTEDPDVFVVAPGVRESGERVTFIRRADGRVSSMFLAVATMARFGPVGSD